MRNVAQVLRLATPTQIGETSFQAQRRVAKNRMITGPAIYDKAPARYYATPKARAKVGWQLRIKHRFSGRSSSDDNVNSIETGKPISKEKLLSSNGECNKNVSSSNTIKPSCEKNLFLEHGLVH